MLYLMYSDATFALSARIRSLITKHLDTSRLKQVYIDDPGGKAMLKERRIILENYERKAFKLIQSPSPTAKVVELRKRANQ